MGTETEIKIRIDDVETFCEHLSSCGATRVSERNFEDNVMLDFPDDRLHRERCVLRIRTVAGKGVLTYKGAPRAEGIFKSREELETEIKDPETAMAIVKRLGMKQSFRYQKYRQEFELNGMHVAVDETPVGDYAEIEGTEAGILALACKLGIETAQFIRLSYHALYVEHCREQGISPQDMVFKTTTTNI